MNDSLAANYKQRLDVLTRQLYLKNKMLAPETEHSIKKKIDTIEQLDNELAFFVEKFKGLLDSGASITKSEISEADINNFTTITKRLKHNVLIISDGLIKISSHI